MWLLPSIGIIKLGMLYLVPPPADRLTLYLTLALFLIVFPLSLMRGMARKGFKQSKLSNLATELEFDEQGMASKNELAESKVQWSVYAKYAVNDKVLLLFQSQRMYSFFPKRCFTDEAWNAFLEIVKRNLKK
jgi:hypothetical protein